MNEKLREEAIGKQIAQHFGWEFQPSNLPAGNSLSFEDLQAKEQGMRSDGIWGQRHPIMHIPMHVCRGLLRYIERERKDEPAT